MENLLSRLQALDLLRFRGGQHVIEAHLDRIARHVLVAVICTLND